MATIDDEPKAAAAQMLGEIITYIKQTRPTRTDNTSTSGFVYSIINPGDMVSPRDFARPWTPLGGTPSPSTATAGNVAAAATAAATTSENVKRAMQAVFNTTQKMDRQLVVTDDGTYSTYSGGGKSIANTYEDILNAMEAPPAAPRSEADQKRIKEANAVLWAEDMSPTPKYDRYQKNQLAYANAIAAFTVAQNKTLSDPATADSWPMLAGTYQIAVDQAYDRWKTQGADEVEAALATVQSLGVPLEQGMIAKARKLLTAWKINISGIATQNPYTYILPSEWAAIETNDIGWTKFESTSNEYHSHYETHQYNLNEGEWRGDASSTSGSAGVSVFGFGFSGSHSQSDASSSSSYSNQGSDGSVITSNAKNLSVTFEYGLCQIVRPWMLTDLFRLQNWYLKGQRAKVISDGTIAGQKNKEIPLLPMIPTHFLVIRNVRITATDWGSVQNDLTTYWDKEKSEYESSSSSTSGGLSIPVWGPLSVSAGVSHSSSEYSGSFKDEAGRDVRNDFGSRFNGNTLEINGAQIVAWLSEIIPASPPLDDPTLT